MFAKGIVSRKRNVKHNVLRTGHELTLVGWSEPLAMMVAWGFNHPNSNTCLLPGVCVKITSALRQASSAVAHTLTVYPQVALISSANACVALVSNPYANPSVNLWMGAVPRAMAVAITPVPIKATLVWSLAAKCFTDNDNKQQANHMRDEVR